MESDKEIFLVAQLDPGEDDPQRDDLYDVGVIATVLQLLKLPDGTVRVLVEGKERAKLLALTNEDKAVMARDKPISDTIDDRVNPAALMPPARAPYETSPKHNKQKPANNAGQPPKNNEHRE